MLLNCLIIDDEPLSQDVIIDFTHACPELVLKGVCKDALEAGKLMKSEKIDLLFLDINMPLLSGISFIKSLKKVPLFIIVTAYPEYALDGFEIDAVDYLLKPVSFERFRTAVNRALERYSATENHETIKHLMVRANKKEYKLNFDEILYLEAQGDYVKFVTEVNSLMVHGTLKDMLSQLPSNQFERIHKSYVISLRKIIYLEGNTVKIADKKLPVSITFKEQLQKKLGA